ncbi:MAG: monooxygenase FAD-binding [Solirubrobacterales bacterium]|nr:monooxygenase FAD-binding [Solirubrobacterales bacterium]
MPDTDVLIVGAGPVGLFLANECARRALRHQIVEARSGQSAHSKALAIMPRTLEIFDMAGIAGPFADIANRVTAATVFSHHRMLARIPFAPEESPYPFVAMVPQDVTEALLVEALQRQGGHVAYDTKCVAVEQHEDRVDVTLEHAGRTSRLSAAYVVGCDGAHSTIRHLLKIPFEGVAYDASFLLADVATNDALPADEMQLCPHEDGPLAIFPLRGDRRRIVATAPSLGDEAPSLELVREIVARRGPAGFAATALHWSSAFRIHRRRAAQLQSGRVFIAGDAAHVHSPFGAQGMNTGLQDVWNLAWKLDFAVGGAAADALLATYSTERRAVIERVIGLTDVITKVMGTPSRLVQGVRDLAIPMVSRLPPFRRGFVQSLSELGIAYRGSPIVYGAGARYLEDTMRAGGVGSHFLLCVGSDAPRPVVDDLRALADEYASVVEMRGSSEPGAVLVRPDGYAAFAARELSEAVPRAVRAVLDLQVRVERATVRA